MTRKGGGRESGDLKRGARPDGNTTRSRGSGDRERLPGSVPGNAAAIPAAHKAASDIEAWLEDRRYKPQRSEMRRMLNVIRELEAELASESLQLMEQQARAEIAEKHFGIASIAYQEQKTRAERAEDRVKELEAELAKQTEPKITETESKLLHDLNVTLYQLELSKQYAAEQFVKLETFEARAERAEARVAELLEAIRQHDEYLPDECEYIEGGRWLKEQPEAREREAKR